MRLTPKQSKIDLFAVLISGSEILSILISKRSVLSELLDVSEYCEFLAVFSRVFRFGLSVLCEVPSISFAKIRFLLA